VKDRATVLASQSARPATATGVPLPPLRRQIDDSGLHYEWVDAELDRKARVATITVKAPEVIPELDLDQVHAAGSGWWPLQMARELDDAILSLRTNEPELGLWILKTGGNADAVTATDRFILEHQDDWFVREVLGMLRRTLARLEVSPRSMFAMVEP